MIRSRLMGLRANVRDVWIAFNQNQTILIHSDTLTNVTVPRGFCGSHSKTVFPFFSSLLGRICYTLSGCRLFSQQLFQSQCKACRTTVMLPGFSWRWIIKTVKVGPLHKAARWFYINRWKTIVEKSYICDQKNYSTKPGTVSNLNQCKAFSLESDRD